MTVGRMLIACVFLSACRSHRAPDAAAGNGGRAPTEAGAAAAPIVGCYVLDTGGPHPYRVHLAPGGAAYLVGPGAAGNSAGDHWGWSGIADSTFVISWSGIDSWMNFTVARSQGTWVADGVITTAHGETKLPTTIEKVGCPLPGA